MDSALLTMILSLSLYFNCDKFEGSTGHSRKDYYSKGMRELRGFRQSWALDKICVGWGLAAGVVP